jgi:hypothetical protein
VRSPDPIHQLAHAIGGLIRRKVVYVRFRAQERLPPAQRTCLGNNCQGWHFSLCGERRGRAMNVK